MTIERASLRRESGKKDLPGLAIPVRKRGNWTRVEEDQKFLHRGIREATG